MSKEPVTSPRRNLLGAIRKDGTEGANETQKTGERPGPEAAKPRRRHRRFSKVRRLLRALGLMAPLVVAAVAQSQQPSAQVRPADARRQQFARSLVTAAVERPKHQVTYDPGYVGIAYPGGDVPADSGVCSDEIVRIFRAVGVDLQKEVHEDIARDPSAYPLMSRWQQKRPDRNIDHRRVPNLMVFFSRQGEELPLSPHAKDYLPGDLVAWDLGNGSVHIGMVVDQKALPGGRYMIVHNIGAGPKMEDVLFDWKIIGHYRYFGPHPAARTPAAGAQSQL